jgi:predicted ATPase
VDADILLVQGAPPDADYRFKHALIQDAPYENLLKSRRQVLHRRVGETLRDKFAGAAAVAPELLAHHFTQAGMTEAAIEWWGKAGHRSLARSALLEAVEQFTRALAQIATLSATPALRRDQISLQVALISPLIHIKGYGAPETKAAVERTRLLMEQAEAFGEPAEEPLLLFSVLYGNWVASAHGYNADVARDLAAQLLALAEKQEAAVPLMIGTMVMGSSLARLGEFAQARMHYNQALALYDPAQHHPLATRFGQDARVTILSTRSWSLWFLGYPDAALADVNQALKDAREIGQATSLMFALGFPLGTLIHCGDYATATKHCDELIALANEKGALYWKVVGMLNRGDALARTGRASDALHTMTSGISAYRSAGSIIGMPLWLSNLATAYAVLGQFDDARRCISEAMKTIETTKERGYEAEVYRVAGEIVLLSPEPAKAEAYFERALTVARQQQAKSWELRASMSLARLWRSQGKVSEARELLAPVYGWFTEGFDTRDLKGAKALLDELTL